MPEEARIPTTKLRAVREMLFGNRRLLGTSIARKLHANHNTFWSWLHRRGMPANKAVALAGIVEEHADKLRALAADLRQAAQDAQ